MDSKELLAQYNVKLVDACAGVDTIADEVQEKMKTAVQKADALVQNPTGYNREQFDITLKALHASTARLRHKALELKLGVDELMENVFIGHIHKHAQTAPFRAHGAAEPATATALVFNNPALGLGVEPHVPRSVHLLRLDVFDTQ